MLTPKEIESLRRIAAALCSAGTAAEIPPPKGWRKKYGLTAGLAYPAGAELQRANAIVRRKALVLQVRFDRRVEWDLYVTTPSNAGVGWRKQATTGWVYLEEAPDVLHQVTGVEGPWWDDLRTELDHLMEAVNELETYRANARGTSGAKATDGKLTLQALRAAYETERNGEAVEPANPWVVRIRRVLGLKGRRAAGGAAVGRGRGRG